MTADAVGGVWTYALDLARGLCARGDEVTLAVLGPEASPDQRAAARLVPGLRLVETGLSLDWTAGALEELSRTARAVAALASDARAQVVHLNSPALANLAKFPAPVAGVAHSCLKTWWAAVRGGDPPGDFGWRIAATAAGYRACDALIAPSAAFAAATQAAYGVAPLVVWNGRPPPPPSAALKDVPVMTAGRLWDEGKGVATLDAAAAQLRHRPVACGPTSGPNGEAVSAPNLDLRGSLPPDPVRRLMARARIFASPALYEPFGLAVLEAAQAGCALVLSDIPTFRELWDGAALFVPPCDAEGFAAALSKLLDDEGEADRLSTAARVRAQSYGMDGFIEGTAAVHRSLTPRHQSWVAA